MASHEPCSLWESCSEDSDSAGKSDSDVEDLSQPNKAAEELTHSLPSAKKAVVGRERTVLVNPPGGRKRRRGGESTKLKSTSKLDRVKQFPGEYLTVDNN